MPTKSPNPSPNLSVDPSLRQVWVDPQIRELSLRETFGQPGTGADIVGDPGPDCQSS